jgi:hypothetical protein
VRSYLKKYPKQKGAGGVAQVVEYLPSKCEFKYQHPQKKKKKKKKKERKRKRGTLSFCVLLYFPHLWQ